MAKEQKIKEQELNDLKELVGQLQKIEQDILDFEIKKHHALHAHSAYSQKLEETKAEMEKEYGKINVNLETGEYVIVPEVEK